MTYYYDSVDELCVEFDPELVEVNFKYISGGFISFMPKREKEMIE